MEAFKRKTILQRNVGLALSALLILGSVASMILHGNDEGQLARALGYTSGVSFGVGLVMLFFSLKAAFALRTEERLRKLFIKSNDERLALATKNAFTMGACIALICIVLASIIAQFFNATVALTLIGVIYFTCLVLVVCKAIYVKKS